MAEPRIKRYALVAGDHEDGIRRFHLARLEAGPRGAPSRDRLERMEEVAALDRRDEEGAARPHGFGTASDA